MGDEEACAVCSLSVVGPKVDTLTAGCCRKRFHDLCIASHCAARRDEVPCPACAKPLRKLVADDTDQSGPSRVPRHVRRGRIDWHLLVDLNAKDATAKKCSALFDIPRARVKLLANGRALAIESEIAAASDAGARLMVLGSNREDVVATTSIAEKGKLFLFGLVKRVTGNTVVRGVVRTVGRVTRTATKFLEPLTPATSRVWCFLSTALKSLHPGWENPYQAGFDERRRRRGGDRRPMNDARPRPPQPPLEPDRNVQPHQLG